MKYSHIACHFSSYMLEATCDYGKGASGCTVPPLLPALLAASPPSTERALSVADLRKPAVATALNGINCDMEVACVRCFCSACFASYTYPHRQGLPIQAFQMLPQIIIMLMSLLCS